MIKTKKIIMGSLATAAIIAIPVVAVVSCGSVTGVKVYETENDGTIIIETGLGSTSNQLVALKDSVDEYNAQQKGTPGFMKVKVVSVEGGYGKLAPALASKINAKKTKGMPNLLVEYADALGVINKNKFALDFSKSKTKFDNKLINDEFMKVNSRIGGADKNGTYMIPLGKSTEILGVNKPLVQMVLKDSGYVPGKNPILDEIFKDTKLNADSKAQSAKWAIKGNKAAIVAASTDEIFTSFDELMKFSDAVGVAYGLKPNGDRFVVGHDAPTNLVYSLGFQEAGYDYKKFLFQKENTKKGYVDYKLFDNGSSENKTFKRIIGELAGHVNKGALKLAGGGEYTSSLLQQHHSIFSIGSSAGYSHLATSGKVNPIFDKALGTTTTPDQDISPFGPVKVFLNHGKLSARSSNSSHVNAVLTQTVKDAGKDKYAKVFPDNIVDELTKTVSASKEFIVLKKDKTQTFPKLKDSKEFKVGDDTYAILPIANVNVHTSSPTDTLQENEVAAYAGLAKNKKTDKGQMAFAQGPSFVGVHANGPEDAATAKFLNWFYNPASKTKTEWKNKYGSAIPAGKTIVEAFDSLSGYITPIAGFEKKLDGLFGDQAKVTKYTKGAQIAFKSFKQQLNGGNVFVAPVDDYSSSLRQILASKVKTIFTTAHTKGHAQSIDEIYKGIKIAAKTNKIIG